MAANAPANVSPSVILVYSMSKVPLSILIALDVSEQTIPLKIIPKASTLVDTHMILPNGLQIQGEGLSLKLIGRLHDSLNADCEPIFDGQRDSIASTQVDYFVDIVFKVDARDPVSIATLSTTLNDFLSYRTFLVGHSRTIADFAAYSQLSSTAVDTIKLPHLARWMAHMRSFPAVSRVESTLQNSLLKLEDRQAAAKSKGGSGASIQLGPEWMGKVVTRFPPEPSGFLHIGHAKAAILNMDLADRYKGRIILRFDDTNPSKEKEEYVDSIISDLETLQVRSTTPITHSSDHFEYLMDMANRMILEGKAYCDFTPVDEMRQQRGDGVESACRSQSIEENLRLWNEMKNGTVLGQTCVLRAKIDMQHKNKTLRDPAMYRCNLTPHHRTGDMYKVYPTYDFTCPLVDSLEGVTHALRTTEYRDRNEQYEWFCQAVGVRLPNIIDFARLNLIYTVLSKRKLTWLVNNNKVTGWNDPRMPTVQGMIRRGLHVAALRDYVIDQGASKSMTFQSWDKIWNINKKIMDREANRYTAIAQNHYVPFVLENGPSEPHVIEVPVHPKDKTKGSKKMYRSRIVLLEQDDARLISSGEEITLMGWGNAIVQRCDRDGDVVTGLQGSLHLQGDVKSTSKKLTWISSQSNALNEFVAVDLIELDHLISTPKLEKKAEPTAEDGDEVKTEVKGASALDPFEGVLKEKTWHVTAALGEPAMKSIVKGQVIQLNRRGFFICDQSTVDGNDRLSLIYVPDGRESAASTLTRNVQM